MGADTLILRFDDREIEATCFLDNSGFIEIRLNKGEPFKVRTVGPGKYQVTQGSDSWLVQAATDGERCWLFLNGQSFVIDVQKKTARRPSKDLTHPHALSVPMTATVRKVLASQGQEVKKGQTLLVLEAMKMEMPLKASGDGTIRQINCREGQIVQPEAQLIEFD